MDLIGLNEGSLPGEVPQAVLDNLILAMGLGGVPILMVALWFVSKITMDKTRVEEIQAQLRSRHATQGTPAILQSASKLNSYQV